MMIAGDRLMSWWLAIDPSIGPQIPGWNKYDPNDKTTLAILGISDSGALPGDHFESDASCTYWNTILPIYPQVRRSEYNQEY